MSSHTDPPPKVVVTDRRTHVEGVSRGTESYEGPEPYVEAVEASGGEVVFGEFGSEDEVVEGVRDATVVVTFQAPISRRVLEAMERCELVLRSGVGVDHIDVQAATEHGIAISNIPGAGRNAIASHAIALMLAAAHDVAYCDRALRGAEVGWGDRTPLNVLDGGTFGIVGLGRIGRAVVEKARSFDMEVIAYDPYLPDDVFERTEVGPVDLDELLARADCVSVHAPHTVETEALLSTAEFERMKPTAVLVNTARGPIVDVDALVAAIEAGELNRATPKTQSALLEAMQERRVTIEGETLPLPDPFMVVATQNPIKLEGTFVLPEAQRDRFQLKLAAGLPSRDEELAMLDRFDERPTLDADVVEPVIEDGAIAEAREAVAAVFVDPKVKSYILDLVAATRESPDVEYGASPRASLAFLNATKALAAVRGRVYVIPDDVKALAPPILVHRLVLSTDAELSDLTPEEIVDEILDTVAVPDGVTAPDG